MEDSGGGRVGEEEIQIQEVVGIEVLLSSPVGRAPVVMSPAAKSSASTRSPATPISLVSTPYGEISPFA